MNAQLQLARRRNTETPSRTSCGVKISRMTVPTHNTAVMMVMVELKASCASFSRPA